MTYVMSDIHGDLDKFRSIMDQINLNDEDHLYVLGDVIDRCPYGIDILYELRDMPNATVLLGNHEKMCYDSMISENGSKLLSTWIKNGGQVTMNALFRMEKAETEEIIDYIKKMPLTATVTVNDQEYLLYKQFYGQFMTVANFGKVIASRILPDRDTRYAGYVYKPTIASFELQEIDGIGEWLTKEEYAELSDNEKRKYSWFEWSEWDDWYDHYVNIAHRVRMQLNFFSEYGFFGSGLDYNLDDRYPDDSDIRLIIYVS